MITELNKSELKKLNKEITAMRSNDAITEKLTQGFKDLLSTVTFLAKVTKK